MNGRITFKYGKLGEVIENIRTFALPFEDQPYTFVMKYEYDSWNRIQAMTYPDGEVVRYGYNFGGMLSRVAGQKDGRSYRYIDSIHYNRFELKDGVWYGNGTRVTYDYDSLQRLSRLQSACADGAMQDIAYTYDSVGNIQRIENGAGTLSNGLGGTYSSNYEYDDLYRLTGANGWWYGEVMSYQMQMEYYPNGRIRRKQLNALSYEQTGTSSSTQTILYDNFYHYNNLQPNTLSSIGDSEQQFGWDASGNMTRHVRGDSERRLCWDEQNRLLGVLDEGRQLSYYLYDANGDRSYKFTGEYTAQNQSGQWHYYYLVDQPTLYASPYLVANRKGYTKHYYAESERIASRIGGGGLQEIGRDKKEHMELFLSHQGRLGDLFETLASCLDAEVRPAENGLKHLYNWRDSVQPETDCYWYHPDHLGSSSWITHTDSHAVQHLHYLPWGENFVDQRSSTFDGARYTFSAKEKDIETGYSYFGSRYYNSDLSIWLSVDPMSGKYPSLSPYTYCADNPVKLVDPNGEAYIPIGDEEAKAAAVAQIQNKTTLTVYIDEDGFLRADGEPKTKIDKFLQNSCDDNKVQVKLDCRNDNLFSWSDGSSKGTKNGGGYDGNFYNGDCVVARQCICPKKLEEYDKSMGDEKAGLTMIHEMAEGYFGGIIAMRKKKGSPMAGVTGSTYDRAHKMATRIAWGNRGGVYREDDFRYNKDTGKIEKGPFKTLIGYARKP